MHIVEGIGHKNAAVKDKAEEGKAQNGKQDSEFEFHGKDCSCKGRADDGISKAGLCDFNFISNSFGQFTHIL